MKRHTLYFIVSYDPATDEMVERIPTAPAQEIKDLFITNGEPVDCVQITDTVYKKLHEQLSINLPLDKADYFVERCSDKVYEYRPRI
jgi:DNA-binding MurR/RpiR family transcriptional regulator